LENHVSANGNGNGNGQGDGSPDVDPMSRIDPLGLGRAWMDAIADLTKSPQVVMEAAAQYANDVVQAVAATGARAMGAEVDGPAAPKPKDRRFSDPAWTENPAYYLLMQGYLLWGRLVTDLVESAELDELTHEKARFTAEMLVDALAPTNFLATNPAATKRAIETGGASLVRGARTFLDDVANNGGLPRMVKPDHFRVGRDLAVTPGKVVYRNSLMELIQYEPATEKVHETPILISPPWINKYYIVDLAPGRSFVQWAVEHGHTVFTISYHNPTSADRNVTFGDYLTKGPLTALDVIEDITGQRQVNMVGICLGGTLTAMMQAYLAKKRTKRVKSATFLNTLTDFTNPGRLGAFTDEPAVRHLEGLMAERGYLESSEMMNTFTFMRSNDLVWNYTVNNWLMGQDPPPFDILSWNSDGTRMPEKMHAAYVRACYINNQFARGEMEIEGVKLDPSKVQADVYVLAAQEDHITPWKGSYMTTQVLSGAKTHFVLSSAGHIAGIVNPPTPKACYRTGDKQLPADPDAWFETTELHQGSWWEDWAEWAKEHGGPMVDPPSMGNAEHTVLGDAPGTYVLEK